MIGERPFTTALAARLLSMVGTAIAAHWHLKKRARGLSEASPSSPWQRPPLSERLASTTSPSHAAIMLRRGFGGSPCLRHRPPERSLGASPQTRRPARQDAASGPSESVPILGVKSGDRVTTSPTSASTRPAGGRRSDLDKALDPAPTAVLRFRMGHLFARQGTSRQVEHLQRHRRLRGEMSQAGAPGDVVRARFDSGASIPKTLFARLEDKRRDLSLQGDEHAPSDQRHQADP